MLRARDGRLEGRDPLPGPVRPAVIFVAGSDPLVGLGGHSSYVRAHGRAAERAGFDPHIVCAAGQDEVVPTDFGTLHRIGSYARLERIEALRVRQHQLVWRAPLLRRAVERLILTRPGTRLIHSVGCYGYVGLAAHRALRRRGVDTVPVVSAYDTLVREGRAKLRGARSTVSRVSSAIELAWNTLLVARCERRGLRGARLVLINYESVRRILAEGYGITDCVRKIPYSSELAFLDGARRAPVPATLARLAPAGAPLIVAVSRQDPRKGLDVLLRALARLRRAGVPFRACLLGGGPLLGAHRRLATRLGLDGAVAIEGSVPDAYCYLQHAAVFVLPSIEEGSGSLSLLEALQAGSAVVASNVDGIPEDVRDGDSALLVTPGDPEDLAGALGRVLREPEIRLRLGGRARAVFEARFSADVFSRALGDVYRELAVTP
jgi:glycosyltransferase involved in cell wall biosynthesis